MNDKEINEKRNALKVLSHALYIQDTEGEDAAIKYLESFKEDKPIKSPIVLSCLEITGRGTVLVVNDEETYNRGDRVWFDDVIYVVTGVEMSAGMGMYSSMNKGLVVKKEKI